MTTETILSNVVYGIPSGNYDGSSEDWSSDAVQAADYYHGRGSVQTVLFVVNAFQGIIAVDATLDADPSSATWFETFTYGDGSTPLTATYAESILGNFTWLRARVTGFSAGTIQSVTASY